MLNPFRAIYIPLEAMLALSNDVADAKREIEIKGGHAFMDQLNSQRIDPLLQMGIDFDMEDEAPWGNSLGFGGFKTLPSPQFGQE